MWMIIVLNFLGQQVEHVGPIAIYQSRGECEAHISTAQALILSQQLPIAWHAECQSASPL
jgi:hypothetical protein